MQYMKNCLDHRMHYTCFLMCQQNTLRIKHFCNVQYHNLGNMLRLILLHILLKQGNHAHKYMMEHILLSTIHTIASMQIISHFLWCEMQLWALDEKTHWLCIFCHERVLDGCKIWRIFWKMGFIRLASWCLWFCSFFPYKILKTMQYLWQKHSLG